MFISRTLFGISVAAFMLLAVNSSVEVQAQDHLTKLTKGEVNLQFAGPMAFGPDGVLFVGDPKAACVFALDTGDREAGEFKAMAIEDLDVKIASALGTSPEKIRINDLAVNPISGVPYVSIARAVDGTSSAMILKVGKDGSINELETSQIAHAKAELPNAPAETDTDRRGRSLRMVSITDLSLIDNRVVVAGLSNEDFASTLRAISYPFSAEMGATALEVYHGAHGKYETNAPVRTFAGITLDNEPHIVAAYTCTPLVRFSLADATSGEKIRGTTVAELGNWNNPLDMFVYKKDGEKFILMANSKRGMMKISTKDIQREQGITNRVERNGIEGQTYETIDGLENAIQMDRFGADHAMVILRDPDTKRHLLKVVPLP